MVDAEKHKKALKPGNDSAPKYNGIDVTDTDLSPDEIEKLAKRCCWFYSCDVLTDEIIEYCETVFEKPLDPVDVMNVAIFTLHGIVKADTDSDKEHIIDMVSGMVNDKFKLNEWIYKMSAVIRANDKTLCDAIVYGETDNLDDKIDKAVKQAEFKAWNTELSVIKRKTSYKKRIDEIKGGLNG